MPLPSPSDYAITMRAGDIAANAWYGVTLGTGAISFTSYGLRPVNPYDAIVRYASAPIVNSDGAAPLAAEYKNEFPFSLAGQIYGDDPDDLRSKLEDLSSRLMLNNLFDVSCLRWGMNDPAASMVYRRLYCKFTGLVAPYRAKVQLSATEYVEITFIAHDPSVYDDTASSDSNVTTGGTLVAALAIGGNYNTSMHRIQIINHLAATTITTPTITLIDGSFTITGTLTAQYDYWDIDCYRGKVTKWTGGGISAADDIANFAGKFPDLGYSVELLQASSVGGTNFTVDNDWLKRFC